jgi:hypothetical protein
MDDREHSQKKFEKIKEERHKGLINNDSLIRRTKGKRRQETESRLQAKTVTASRIRNQDLKDNCAAGRIKTKIKDPLIHDKIKRCAGVSTYIRNGLKRRKQAS